MYEIKAGRDLMREREGVSEREKEEIMVWLCHYKGC